MLSFWVASLLGTKPVPVIVGNATGETGSVVLVLERQVWWALVLVLERRQV